MFESLHCQQKPLQWDSRYTHWYVMLSHSEIREWLGMRPVHYWPHLQLDMTVLLRWPGQSHTRYMHEEDDHTMEGTHAHFCNSLSSRWTSVTADCKLPSALLTRANLFIEVQVQTHVLHVRYLSLIPRPSKMFQSHSQTIQWSVSGNMPHLYSQTVRQVPRPFPLNSLQNEVWSVRPRCHGHVFKLWVS